MRWWSSDFYLSIYLSIYLYIEIEGTSTACVKFSCYNKKRKSGFMIKDRTRRKKIYFAKYWQIITYYPKDIYLCSIYLKILLNSLLIQCTVYNNNLQSAICSLQAPIYNLQYSNVYNPLSGMYNLESKGLEAGNARGVIILRLQRLRGARTFARNQA